MATDLCRDARLFYANFQGAPTRVWRVTGMDQVHVSQRSGRQGNPGDLLLQLGIIAFQIAAGILDTVQQKLQERGGFVAFGEMAGRTVEDPASAVGLDPRHVADHLANPALRVLDPFDIHRKQRAEIQLLIRTLETIRFIAVHERPLAAKRRNQRVIGVNRAQRQFLV